MSTKKVASCVWNSEVTYGICCAIIILCAAALWMSIHFTTRHSIVSACIIIGIVLLIGALVRKMPESPKGILYEVTKGTRRASIKVWHYSRDMNSSIIEVYNLNKIKVSVGDETEIIPVSESAIAINHIEPIHRTNPGGLFFGSSSTDPDRIVAYVVKVSYKNATTQEQ